MNMTLSKVQSWMHGAFELGDHNRRLPSMEGLRGFAILLVFVCHYNGIIGEHLALPGAVASVSRVIGVAGSAGVDLFFMLSGFLIYRTTLKPSLNVVSFLMRRAERIYPTFLVVFACYLLLGAVNLAPSRLPLDGAHRVSTIVANLLFLPGMFDLRAIIGAAWSLSYEWFFYLALPLVVVGLQLCRWNRAGRVGLMFGLCVAYVAFCLAVPSAFPAFANYDGSHVRLIMFVCGMIVYELLDSRRFRELFRPRIESICVGVAAVAGLTLVGMIAVGSAAGTPVDGNWSARTASIQVIPTFVAVLCLGLVVLRNDGRLAYLFKSTWLRWTGNISYSFYLVHSIPMHFMTVLLTHGPASHVSPLLLYVVALPFTIVLTYVVAAALFIGVEKPISLRPKKAKLVAVSLQAA